jgi:hypothetical protein
MKVARLLYRARQFWHALGAAPSPASLEEAQSILNPAQMALFRSMQASEQAHALRVMVQLRSQGSVPPDLLVAALLHDVGKNCYPLGVWVRVIIVLVRAFFPAMARQWGNVDISGDPKRNPAWRKPFVVAEQHPVWGAEMALKADVSPLAAALIRRHQNFFASKVVNLEDQLLLQLQAADNDH